jgi:hypothetical protein
MTVMMVRSKVKAESAADVEAAVRRMFSAIESAQPQGVRYASCRTPDRVTYVALLEVEDGIDNPLATLPSFKEFQDSIRAWLAEPPEREQWDVVGSYRLF